MSESRFSQKLSDPAVFRASPFPSCQLRHLPCQLPPLSSPLSEDEHHLAGVCRRYSSLREDWEAAQQEVLSLAAATNEVMQDMTALYSEMRNCHASTAALRSTFLAGEQEAAAALEAKQRAERSEEEEEDDWRELSETLRLTESIWLAVDQLSAMVEGFYLESKDTPLASFSERLIERGQGHQKKVIDLVASLNTSLQSQEHDVIQVQRKFTKLIEEICSDIQEYKTSLQMQRDQVDSFRKKINVMLGHVQEIKKQTGLGESRGAELRSLASKLLATWSEDNLSSSKDSLMNVVTRKVTESVSHKNDQKAKTPVVGKLSKKGNLSFRNRPPRSPIGSHPPVVAPVAKNSSLPKQFLKKNSCIAKPSNYHEASFPESGIIEEDMDDEEDSKEEPVEVCGYLMKRSAKFSFWRKRYVVLHVPTAQLEWFRTRENYISRHQTNDVIDILPSTRLWQPPKSTCFTLHNGHREWMFDASTREELFRWLEPLCLVFRKVLEIQRGPKSKNANIIATIVKRPSIEEVSEEESMEEESV